MFQASIRAVRKNLFLRQTLAARISAEMQFGLEGEQQVLLGGNSGLRGYDLPAIQWHQKDSPQPREPNDFLGAPAGRGWGSNLC